MHHLPMPQTWSLWAFQAKCLSILTFCCYFPDPALRSASWPSALVVMMVLYGMSQRTPVDILEVLALDSMILSLWPSSSWFHPLTYDICSAPCIWWLILESFYTLDFNLLFSSQLSCFPHSSSYALGEEIFSYPTWGLRNPSWWGKTSFCFSPTSPNFLPLSSHTLLPYSSFHILSSTCSQFQWNIPAIASIVPRAQLVNKCEIWFIFYSRLSIGGLKLKGRKSVKYISCHYPKLKKLYFFVTRKCWLETLEKSPVVFID